MRVTVMGAGVIGVTASSLAREGAEVTVLDRLRSAAIERASMLRHLRPQGMCHGGVSLAAAHARC